LILFGCAKHSILPRKTGTWEKRVPSSCFSGQNGMFSATEQNQTYKNSFFL
jgi:hypothetical protein